MLSARGDGKPAQAAGARFGSGKLSTHFLASNQLRLWLASFAYLLKERLRALGCHGTELARATVGSVRVKLLKVAARVTVSVRRLYIQLSSGLSAAGFVSALARSADAAGARGRIAAEALCPKTGAQISSGRRSVGTHCRKTPFSNRPRSQTTTTAKKPDDGPLLPYLSSEKSKKSVHV